LISTSVISNAGVLRRNVLTMKQLPVAVSCVVLISILIGCRNSHDQESFYPFLADAKKDGAMTHGWIPDDFLPRSSRAIHEVHDLSPSLEWCTFEFAPTDSQNLLGNLRRVDALPPSVSHVPNPGMSWWPYVLMGQLDVEKIHKAGFDLYVIERPATSVTTTVWLFAID